MVRVKVKEEPEDDERHAAGRSVYRWVRTLCAWLQREFVQVNEEAPVEYRCEAIFNLKAFMPLTISMKHGQ